MVPFAYLQVQAALTALGASSASAESSLSLRTGTGKAGPVVTDNGNFLIDAVFSLDDLKSPVQVETLIGKVVHGLITARRHHQEYPRGSRGWPLLRISRCGSVRKRGECTLDSQLASISTVNERQLGAVDTILKASQ